ncbi:MAG: hypothetical protein Q4E67_05000, partial [Planctomycetia bacterium]|nr:hypothetical protein [Planctomycetia bacterium]
MKRFLGSFLAILFCSPLAAEEVNMTSVRHFLREMQRLERLQSPPSDENILYLTELPSEHRQSPEPVVSQVVTETSKPVPLPDVSEKPIEEKEFLAESPEVVEEPTPSKLAEPAALHIDDNHIEPLLPVNHEEAVPVPTLPPNAPVMADTLGTAAEKSLEKRP